MLLRDLLERYEREYVPGIIDQSRTKSCLKNLATIGGDAEDVTMATLLAYRKTRVAGGVVESTANRDMAVLGSALKWARHSGLTKANPEIPRTRETASPKVISFRQFTSLVENARDIRVRSFIELAFYTGQRKQAVLQLKHSQIRNGLIYFEDQEGPMAHRRKHRATTPLNKKIRAILARLKAEFGNTKYVIPNGIDDSFVTLDKGFHAAAVAAGIPWVTPHVLRHSCCTVLLENNRPMQEVSRHLGHRSIATTEKFYAHFSPDFLRETSAVFDRL